MPGIWMHDRGTGSFDHRGDMLVGQTEGKQENLLVAADTIKQGDI